MSTIFTVLNSSRTFLKACEMCQFRSKNFRRYQKPDESDGLRATSWQVLCCLVIKARMLISFRVITEITSTFKKCPATDTGHGSVSSLQKAIWNVGLHFFQQMYVHGSRFINSWNVLMDCKSVLMFPVVSSALSFGTVVDDLPASTFYCRDVLPNSLCRAAVTSGPFYIYWWSWIRGKSIYSLDGIMHQPGHSIKEYW